MIVLGIESTAHTFGASVLEDEEFLSNERSVYTTEEGGMVPYELAEHHVEHAKETVQAALDEADVRVEDIDLIAFSQSPGIGHALRIGAQVARALAILHDLPIVGVNHCIAHLEIGRLFADEEDPVLLYASGANTQVIAYEAEKYRVFGETLDIGVGNFLDTFGRDIGLGFPAGPEVEKLAAEGNRYIELPYVVKGMDTSFGGLRTNLKNKIHNKDYRKEDLCYSVQETVFAMLVEVAERAMAHTGKESLVLGGGVACNKRLQEMCRIMCEERGASFHVPENEYLVDNAAMIAWTGKLMYEAGNQMEPEETVIKPYLRTDEVDVNWR